MLPFLPALVGMGLKTAGLTALRAGVLTGLGTAIATRDIGKGLTAGLGAFGGAGLGEAAGTAGQAADAANQLSNVATAQAGKAAIPTVAQQASTQFANLPDAAARFSSMGEGLSALTSGGQAGAQALQAAGGGGSLAMSGLTALTPTLETEMDMPQTDPAMIRPSSYDPATQTFKSLTPYLAKNGGVVPGLNSQIRMNMGGMTNQPIPTSSMFDPMSNRVVQGRGDGMSDSVAGNIDGEQDVRLSVDEFVVPADVVSGLGNGSSTAGAKKLYNMMDNVREERTGKTRQAPEVDAARLMPA